MESIGVPTSTVRRPNLDNAGPLYGKRSRYFSLSNARNQGVKLEGLTDSAPASHIISHFKLLHFSPTPLNKLAHEECTDGVGGVSLLGICLDNDTAIHVWLMVLFVSTGVGWVDGMSHIR